MLLILSRIFPAQRLMDFENLAAERSRTSLLDGVLGVRIINRIPHGGTSLLSMTKPIDTTDLLGEGPSGDREAFDRLFGQVYQELRRIAHQRLRRHRRGETLSTTALVHEAYLKLFDQPGIEKLDRAHFLALAARAMRFVLVDYARTRLAKKRGGGAGVVRLEAVQVAADERAADVLSLHEALETLAARDQRLSRMVEYRFFGGLTYEEIAQVTGCSVPTVKRDWGRARAWLYHSMRASDDRLRN